MFGVPRGVDNRSSFHSVTELYQYQWWLQQPFETWEKKKATESGYSSGNQGRIKQ
jgi:hypothetical protein